MNCITPFFNKHIHLAPQLFTFMDNYAKNKKNILTGKIMSNSNEPNTDEQIAQLDQKLRAMNTSANQNRAYEAADPQDPLFAQHAEEYENHTRYAENNPADADPQEKDEEVPLSAQFQDEHARHSQQAEHMERTEETERAGQTEQAETPSMAEKCFKARSASFNAFHPYPLRAAILISP